MKQTKRPIFHSVAGFAVNGKPFATELKNGCRIVQRTRLYRHFPLAFTSLCVHVHIALCSLVEINSLRPGSGLDTIERTLDKAGCLGTIELTTVYTSTNMIVHYWEDSIRPPPRKWQKGWLESKLSFNAMFLLSLSLSLSLSLVYYTL